MNAPTNSTFVDSSMRSLVERISYLPIDERAIVETLLTRMELGRRLYGPWIIDGDNRDYPVEALAEVIDSLHYCAAELIRGRRLSSTRRKRVYVCHPFSGDVSGNTEKIRKICRELVDEGVLPSRSCSCRRSLTRQPSVSLRLIFAANSWSSRTRFASTMLTQPTAWDASLSAPNSAASPSCSRERQLYERRRCSSQGCSIRAG
ncbi:MAG TPA: hypothetical protein VKP30_25020, partial [Polyangiaceae bacterium]|nr:hypothetical protein [Polyangiaceae bacterium]